MQRFSVICIAVGACVPSLSTAAPDQNSSSNQHYDRELQEVDIPDTRQRGDTTQTISSVTRLTREDIRASGVRTTDELLRNQAGVQLSRTGGPGSLTSFYLRGAEADTTAVFINGVRVQSINTGFTFLNELPVDSIERIEIIRGPQSALYGSTAPGGIIKVYTIPTAAGAQFRVGVQASDQDAIQSQIAASGQVGNTTVYGNGNWVSRDGLDACSDASACFETPLRRDLDGVEQINGQVGLNYQSDYGQQVSFSHLQNKSRVEFDGSFFNESDTIQQVTSLQLTQPFNDNQQLQADFGYYDESVNSFDAYVEPRALASTYGTERFDSSLIHNWQSDLMPQFSLTTGVDFDQSELVDSDLFPEIERQSTGAFTEAELSIDKLLVRLGGRRDQYKESVPTDPLDRTQYASTGHIKLAYSFNDQWALKGSYGNTFNMPTFAELYFPGFSNPDLGPERHIASELGLEFTQQHYRGGLFAFQTLSSDLIIVDGVSLASLGSSKVQGVEWTNFWQWQNFSVNGNATYLNARSEAFASENNRLPRRPNWQFAGDIAYQWRAQTRLRLGLFTSGKRFDDLANTRPIGGYTLFDLGLRHSVTEQFEVGVRVENIFDKDYQTVFGYRQPDRAVWLSAQYALR